MSDVLVLNADFLPVSALPLSVVSWETAVRALYLGTVATIHEYDDWEVHSPSTTIKVPSVIMTKKYLHFQRTVAFTERNLFLRDRYTCQYCGQVFPEQKLTFDHYVPRKDGGRTRWDNIVSACAPCNGWKGHNRTIEPLHKPYKPTYYQLLALRKEYPLVVAHESWVGYLDWPEENVIVKGGNILRRRRAA
jgi:5-methylcytosine-specific restriction endonuclease McrA